MLSLVGGMGVVGISVFLLIPGALPVLTQQEQSALLPNRQRRHVEMPTPIPRSPTHSQPLDGDKDKSDRLDFLTPEQRELAARLEATYITRLAAILGSRARPTLQDLAALAQMEKERRAAIAKVLGPQLAEQYELAQSRTANFIRKTMGDFKMTEQEFRSLYKIRIQWEDENGPSYISETMETLPARLDLELQIRQVLGEERYTHYMREQNWVVSTLQKVASDYSIPKETAVLVFDLKAPAQEQVVQIRANLDLSPEQRQAALQEVQSRTLQAIAHLIGRNAAEEYYRQGTWIRNLAQDLWLDREASVAKP